MFCARCPRCYRLELVKWEETYYHIPRSWKILTAIGAKKVRCKPCRHNFISFRKVKGVRKWENGAPETPLAAETIIGLNTMAKKIPEFDDPA